MTQTLSPWPSFTEQEQRAVQAVLASGKVNYWTGNEGKNFEREFADYLGCEYGVALANGTLALELALLAGGIGPGDEVVVTPRTFFASVSSIARVGATPVFADVSLSSQNITAESIAAVLTERTRAIICVHLAGWPCDMDDIMTLAEARDLLVIEDCAQAHGAHIGGRYVGSLGHIAAWSFCQDKIMTTGGEGGMLTTSDRDLWERAWSLKDHGKSWDAVQAKNAPAGFRWLHQQFGSNFRMTEMQSAIGRCQIRCLDAWVDRRQAIAGQLSLACLPYRAVTVPEPGPGVRHARYRHYISIDIKQLHNGMELNGLIAALNANGVPAFQGSCPEVYLEPAFDKSSWKPAQRLPNAQHLGLSSLCFLVHPTLRDDEVVAMCEGIRRTFDAVFA